MKIIFIIPRGECFRNFVYTNILTEIGKTHELVIFSVFPNLELKNKLFEITSDVFEIKNLKISYLHRYFLKLLDLTHGFIIKSAAQKSRIEIRLFENNTILSKAKLLCNLTIARLFSKNNRVRFVENILNFLSKKEKEIIRYKKQLQKLNPDLVVNLSLSHSRNSYCIIQAALQLKIHVNSYVFSWDNILTQGRIYPYANSLFCWNELNKNQILENYKNIYNKSQIHTVGTPQFFYHFNSNQKLTKEKFYKSLLLSPETDYILYTTGMSNHIYYEEKIIESIANWVKSQNLKLVVRTYIKDNTKKYEILKKNRKDIIFSNIYWEKNHYTPLPSDSEFYTYLLKECVVGINIASTVSLELCLLNKPVINIAYNKFKTKDTPLDYLKFYTFEHYKMLVDYKAVELAKSEEQLWYLLKLNIQNHNKNYKNRKRFIVNFFDEKEFCFVKNKISNSPEKYIKSIHKLLTTIEKY